MGTLPFPHVKSILIAVLLNRLNPHFQDHAIEEGAIAIGRAADPDMDAGAVHAEIDAIAQEALRRLAADFAPLPLRPMPPPLAEPLSSLEEAYLSAVDGMHESELLPAPASAPTCLSRPSATPVPPDPAAASAVGVSQAGGSGLERAYLAGLDRAGEARAPAAAGGGAAGWRGRGRAGGLLGTEPSAAEAAAAAADGGGSEGGAGGACSATGGWADQAVRALNCAMFEARGYSGNRED